MNARDKISRAIIKMLREQPFFAAVAMSHKIVENSERCSTIATNGKELVYNPKWIESRSEQDLETIMIHEVMHVTLGHHLRVEGLEAYELPQGEFPNRSWFDMWQKAADCAVNGLLETFRKMPEDATTAKALGLKPEQTAEGYYWELRGREKGDGVPKENSMGEVLPSPDMTTDGTENQRIESEWRQGIVSAAMQAEEAGKLPGFIKQLVDAMLEPATVPWPVMLRQFCTRTIRRGTNWSRPNRRQGWRKGIVIPAKRSRTVDNVMLAVDTSGSMSEADMKLVLSELQSIMSAYPGATVTFVEADTQISHTQTFSASQPFNPAIAHEFSGRGGTDMDPVVDLAKKVRPQALILLTDGYMSWPDNPGLPTMWLMTTDQTPPWGQVVRMR